MTMASAAASAAAASLNGPSTTPNNSKNGEDCIIDLEIIATNGMFQPSPSTVAAYLSLPIAIRNVIAQTIVFHFQKRPRTPDDLRSEYTRKAQFYVDLISEKKENLFLISKLPVVLGIKCAYCERANNHVPGCVSLLALDSPLKYDALKQSLRARLKHILDSCPNAKKEFKQDRLSGSALFGEHYNEMDSSIDKFVTSWLSDFESVCLERNSKQQRQHQEQKQKKSPPISLPSAQRTVIDVRKIVAGTCADDGSLRVALVLFNNLPDPLQIVLAKTAVCTFFRRQATKATDGEKYSEEAAKYLNGLERLRPHMIQEALSTICFYCACCGAQHKFVGIKDGIELAAHILVESLRQLTNHTARCITSKKIIGRQASSTLMNFNLNSDRPVIQQFARMWLIHLNRVYVSNPQVPQDSIQQLKVAPFFNVTVNGNVNGNQYQENGQPADFSALKQILLLQEQKQQNPKQAPPQIVATQQTTFRAASKSTPPKQFPKQTTPNPKKASPKTIPPPQTTVQASSYSTTLQQNPMRRPETNGNSASTQPPPLSDEVMQFYDLGLDDLEFSMLRLYDIEDDDHLDDNGARQRKLATLVPLPPPKLDADIYVPLQPHEFAKFPRGVPFLEGASSQDLSIERPAKRIRQTASLSPISLLGRTFKQHDVVIPTKGCSSAMVMCIHDLIGNRCFMREISNNRDKYFKLITCEEKAILARQLVNKIKYSQKGVFYKATTRYSDGKPLIWPCKDSSVVSQQENSTSDVLLYTMCRLEKGFEDLLHPWDVGRSYMLPTRSSRTKTRIRVGEIEAIAEGNESKVVTVEHAPLIGLFGGDLVWNYGNSMYPRIALGELATKDAMNTGETSIVGDVGTRESCSRLQQRHSDPQGSYNGDNVCANSCGDDSHTEVVSKPSTVADCGTVNTDDRKRAVL